MLTRLSTEAGRRLEVTTVSGRGGHGRAVTEFRAWQRASSRGLNLEIPDLLVLMIDANCSGWTQKRRELDENVDTAVFPRFVIGCPDPHIERWCLADPEAVKEVVGTPPLPDPGKCDRGVYKQLLRRTILDAGQPILTNEMEYAPDLVESMDLYRAGKNQPSLRHFVDEIRRALATLG
jgi:hypothetical protein